MPTLVKSSTKSAAAAGRILPAQYAVGTHYTNPLDRRHFQELLASLEAGALGSGATVDGKLQTGSLGELVNDLDLDADTGLVLRNGASDNVKLAIQFTTPAGGGYTVDSIQLRLKGVGTIAAGKKVTVNVQGDTGSDVPDTTDLLAAAVAGDKTPDAISTSEYETVTFALTTPLHLAASTKYWIIVEGDYAASAANHLLLGIDTVASGGNINIKDAAWSALVATQTGHAAVLGYAWTDLAGAAFTQVTEANDVAPRPGTVDLAKAPGTHIRGVATVATAASFFALVLLLLGPHSAPVGETFDFEV